MSAPASGHWAAGLTSASVVWASALAPAAFFIPVYGTETTRLIARPGTAPLTDVRHGSASLIAANGTDVRLIVVIALPAALAVIAWIGLRALCTRGRISGRRVATTAIIALAALTLLTGFSIGVEMFPALALLMAGWALTPAGASQPPT
jgi:hypothetical protein